MTPKRYVVLGGTGFIGSHLLAALAGDGHRITVLSRNREQKRAINVLPNVRTISTDVYDRASLEKYIVGSDAVVNLVGILNETGDATFTHAHVNLTATLIAACRQAGVRRIHLMSSLNAGNRASKYLKTRGEAEAQVRNSGLDWTIYRASVVYGDGDGFVSRFLKLLRMGPVLPLAQPHAKFQPVWVRDVAAAIRCCLGDRASIGRIHELYGPDTLELVAIVRMIRDAAGLRRVVSTASRSRAGACWCTVRRRPGTKRSPSSAGRVGLSSPNIMRGSVRIRPSPTFSRRNSVNGSIARSRSRPLSMTGSGATATR